ncbi:MAG: hypothetical protein K5798_09730 [Nitrosopumilus sp.]|uniref:Uncharacterized protein n=1 Tax=Nitrosopumilus zosterae TaxID=718286 RepID=A0A2S2KNX4_9ARCH|nr:MULTISPECIES: hypothetical protein [Nitrosopumilus]MCV0367524.1 hypothetical protein [Nitrosopumilus sp.]BDQ31126.1 hypothetical protein NZOSNM25_001236 [Nitrosopumilus zosterae]GBH33339.1 hypothetical protein NZNM25_01300 [Nitrosopumilus zosterae]
MSRSRTITITVKKKTGDAFDAILQAPPKMMPDATINNDGWWLFTGPHGKSQLKFNENKSLGILDYQFIDEESTWNVPMRVVSNGDFSDVVITLNKPDELTDAQFDQRISEIGDMVVSMKNIIESY